MNIEGKKITVVGAKRSGMALARLIVRLKGLARISDQGSEDALPEDFRNWAGSNNVAFEFGGHSEAFIADSDMIVLSPGVSYFSECAEWAKGARIPVVGEIEFAAQYCPCPIIAVTGSNGKTTVSTLISKVLEQAGKANRLCGNVGSPFSDYVLDLQGTEYVVLEVSSFQMESVHDNAALGDSEAALGLKGFKPAVAIILNFSQNHLDRHKDMDEYFGAKKRIAINQDEGDYLVLNAKDDISKTISANAQVVHFNQGDHDANPNHSAVLSVAHILGIDPSLCQQVFSEFEGVEHRLEKVRMLDGVEFINDSKATTAQSALWALNSINRPVVMICGGRDKNIDFSILSDAVRAKVKHMYVIGEARPKIREAFGDVIDLDECDGLEEAVEKAKSCASQGDCVLLSPMCASFDMFTDFEERGKVFKSLVNELT